jgi:hypothetical protein
MRRCQNKTIRKKPTGAVQKKWRSQAFAAGLLAALASLAPGARARAADMSWSGYYRFEGTRVHGPEMDSNGRDKAYMLQHLVLSPKIVAADGLTVYGRFDIFNNAIYGQNNQLGEFLGDGTHAAFGPRDPGNGSTTNAGNSNVLSRAEKSGMLAITSLYAVWNQEFGSLVVGRVPIQFGLGVVHNAGNGMFDHYFESKDIVGYKVVMGNLMVMPMYGKVSEGDIGYGDDVMDYMVHVQYDNPETDLSLGVFFEERVSTIAGNDAPISANATLPFGGPGSTQTGGYKTSLWSVYSKQRVHDFTIAVEGDFFSGDSGVTAATGQSVSINSFGVAAEIGYKPEDSRWASVLKVGMATGDDPGTVDVFEGFAFSRNYDVAFLLFNHPLGRFDVLRTGQVRDTSVTASSQPDTEALSNAIYIAPNIEFRWRDNLSLNGTLAYAMLNKDPIAFGNTAKDLGYEIDMGVTYKPYDRLTWKTQVGFLIPGDAWRGGYNGYENRLPYGVETKAAISF